MKLEDGLTKNSSFLIHWVSPTWFLATGSGLLFSLSDSELVSEMTSVNGTAEWASEAGNSVVGKAGKAST